MSSEYIIYTDESTKGGKFFANFYGGALVRSADFDTINGGLRARAVALGLTGEVKWQKVSEAYVQRYMDLMDTFFDLVAEDRVKVRVMFTQTRHVPTGLTSEQRQNEYHILYYYFLKYGFGLRYSNPSRHPISLRVYLDQLPDTREKNARFKRFVAGLEKSSEFQQARLRVPADQIAEVDSHDHIILQCLDVVLGAMQFRLNDMHKEKPAGQGARGKRTIAKERLYKHINRRIASIYPQFNIGISTGTGGTLSNRWHHPYRHWLFMPSEYRLDRSKQKP